MAEESSGPESAAVPGTGVNDHACEREHRHPTAEQIRVMGHRRRDAEAKLEQHLQEAKRRTEEYEDNDD